MGFIMCAPKDIFDYHTYFLVGFVRSMFIIGLLLIVIICKGWIDCTYLTRQIRATSVKRFFFGLGIAFLSGICWFIAEEGCHESNVFKLFPGHALFHIGLPYGLMNTMVLIVILKAPSLGKRPKFYTNIYFTIMPGLYFESFFVERFDYNKDVLRSSANAWSADKSQENPSRLR